MPLVELSSICVVVDIVDDEETLSPSIVVVVVADSLLEISLVDVGCSDTDDGTEGAEVVASAIDDDDDEDGC